MRLCVCLSSSAAKPSCMLHFQKPLLQTNCLVLLLLLIQAIRACTKQLVQRLCWKQSPDLPSTLSASVCVCNSSNAAKAFCMLLFQKPLLQRRLFSSSASAYPGHQGMHNTAVGSKALLSQSVLCMLSASVCLSQQQCSNSCHACCFFPNHLLEAQSWFGKEAVCIRAFDTSFFTQKMQEIDIIC